MWDFWSCFSLAQEGLRAILRHESDAGTEMKCVVDHWRIQANDGGGALSRGAIRTGGAPLLGGKTYRVGAKSYRGRADACIGGGGSDKDSSGGVDGGGSLLACWLGLCMLLTLAHAWK